MTTAEILELLRQQRAMIDALGTRIAKEGITEKPRKPDSRPAPKTRKLSKQERKEAAKVWKSAKIKKRAKASP